MLSAASAWSALAAELHSAATGYGKVVDELGGEGWLGPAATSMEQAATPYLAWLTATAAYAEQSAAQARAAGAAYEAALAAIVPPPVVAANRVQLANLLSSNVLGQNAAAIAANQAQYGEMWAQDAATMYRYATQSAAAAKVTPFTSAPQITNPVTQAGQGTAVSAAQATAAGTGQQTLAQLISAMPGVLQGLASPLQTSTNPLLTQIWFLLSGQTTLPSNLGTLITGYNSYSALWYNTEGLPYFSVGMANFGVQIAKTTGAIGAAAPEAAAAIPKAVPGLAEGLRSGAVAAGLGSSASLGKLSVPASWAASTAIPSHELPKAIESISTASEPSVSGNVLGGLPITGLGTGASGSAPRYGFKPVVMARPPFAG